MASEPVEASRAANRDVSDLVPGPTQDCHAVVHIAVFFDGTGNNKDLDNAASKWSNIARMYQSAKLAADFDSSGTLFPIYISGVGTAFNGKAVDWLSAAVAWVEDGIPGQGAAAGGDRRMEHGGDTVNERLRDVLIANANARGGSAAKYASENADKGFVKVNEALAEHRLIKVINLSFFGFSRGAALARAFANRIVAKCSRDGALLLYEGHPLRLNFMGLFDTVASFGVPATNARTPFTERDLIVPTAVERCVHYVAAHEVRFSFPVDLIRKNGELADQWSEKTYPGVHSDVGGGYEPMAQQIDNNFARIPMREMMRECLASGVRMLSYDDIKKKLAPLFTQRFECRPETEVAYARYQALTSGSRGTVEQQVKEHLKLYYMANGTMHRRGIESPGDRSRKASKFKTIVGSKGMASEVEAYRSLHGTGSWLRLGDTAGKGFAQYIKIYEWQLAAWDTDAPKAALDFVSKYIHDSKVDFLGNIEPFSYFRPRGIEESTISVWQEGGNWIRSKRTTVGNAVDEAVGTGSKKAAALSSSCETAIGRVYESGVRWVQQRLKGAGDPEG